MGKMWMRADFCVLFILQRQAYIKQSTRLIIYKLECDILLSNSITQLAPVLLPLCMRFQWSLDCIVMLPPHALITDFVKVNADCRPSQPHTFDLKACILELSSD